MKPISMWLTVILFLGLGGCADSEVCDVDFASRVDWPPVYRPSPRVLYAMAEAKGVWRTMAHGSLADVRLDERLFSVDNSDGVYVRLLVVNTASREIGVLLHTEDVLLDGRRFVLPPPGGAKLAVSEEEFAAEGHLAVKGPLPEQQVDAPAPARTDHGVLVTVPPLASLEVFRRLEHVRRSTAGPGAPVTVWVSPGVIATDGRCIERLGSAAAELQSPAAWRQVPLGSLTLSGHGPARLVPSTQPNLIRRPPDVIPNAAPERVFTPLETQPAP